MDLSKQREIASKGGKAAHARGRAPSHGGSARVAAASEDNRDRIASTWRPSVVPVAVLADAIAPFRRPEALAP